MRRSSAPVLWVKPYWLGSRLFEPDIARDVRDSMIASISLYEGSSSTMGRMFSLPAEVMIAPVPICFSMAHIAKSLSEPGMSSSARHAFISGRRHWDSVTSSRRWSRSAVTPERPPAFFFLRHFILCFSSGSVTGSMMCAYRGSGEGDSVV